MYYGFPEEVFKHLTSEYNIRKVFANHDHEPYAIGRDLAIQNILKGKNIEFHSYKDHVIFEKDEVFKEDGKPYTVFTPYSRKWKNKLNRFYLKSYPAEKYHPNFNKQIPHSVPTLQSMGFVIDDKPFSDQVFSYQLISNYRIQRNFPSANGTSRLGVHLRFGTISIRELVTKTAILNETFLNELIWRDFYQVILWHFPHVGNHKAFKPEYDSIEWRNNEIEFDLWCKDQTGYPIVDAGMRELKETGFMHNRVRMSCQFSL